MEKLNSFLDRILDWLGSIKGGGLGFGQGRWNPMPVGMYADWIIQSMGATPDKIEEHLRRVIVPEVEKDLPFVYVEDINGDPTKGFFIDKTTRQLYQYTQP